MECVVLFAVVCCMCTFWHNTSDFSRSALIHTFVWHNTSNISKWALLYPLLSGTTTVLQLPSHLSMLQTKPRTVVIYQDYGPLCLSLSHRYPYCDYYCYHYYDASDVSTLPLMHVWVLLLILHLKLCQWQHCCLSICCQNLLQIMNDSDIFRKICAVSKFRILMSSDIEWKHLLCFQFNIWWKIKILIRYIISVICHRKLKKWSCILSI